MKLLMAAILLTGFSANFSFASNLDRENQFEARRELKLNSNTKILKDIIPISIEGRLRCANETHAKYGNCELELVSNSGKIYEIANNPKLSSRHCQNHKDLIVSLSATKNPSFLFWGGNITVESYNVQQEVDTVKSIKSYNRNFDRLERLSSRFYI
jgi:hypothetical protein